MYSPELEILLRKVSDVRSELVFTVRANQIRFDRCDVFIFKFLISSPPSKPICEGGKKVIWPQKSAERADFFLFCYFLPTLSLN